jgi:hypothetical protein
MGDRNGWRLAENGQIAGYDATGWVKFYGKTLFFARVAFRKILASLDD